MRKVLLSLLISSILLISGIMLISGISFLLDDGRRAVTDMDVTFTKAKIDLGDEVIEVEVKSWRDYKGDAVLIVTEYGDVYLTSYENAVLMNN